MILDFEPSSYQKDILNYIDKEEGNLLVDAKAGSGKTSSLLLIANKLIEQDKRCLFLAFNKSIVNELDSKIDNKEYCLIKTLHSLGLTFLKSHLYKQWGQDYNLEIDTSKLRTLCKNYYEKYFLKIVEGENPTLPEEELKDLHSNLLTDLVNLCNFSRFYNVNYKQEGSLNWLVYRFSNYLVDYIDVIDYQDLVIAVIDRTKELFENPTKDENNIPTYYVDYTDMIYFPVYYNMNIPFSIKKFLDIILLDESQDLSVLQQKFVSKLKTATNRFIFVGDEKQAIYGFAGADTKSIKNLKYNFVLKELPLNICYRCPKKVIKVAKDIVPDIEWNSKREDEGIVEVISKFDIKRLMDENTTILFRKNKDIISQFRKFCFVDRTPVKLRNKDLVRTLTNDMDRTIKEYVQRYNKGLNVEKELYKHMNEYKKQYNLDKKDKQYKDEFNLYKKKLITDNLNTEKELSKSNINIHYLRTCMQEYKEKGAYTVFEIDDLTRDLYDVISDLLNDYEENNNSILVKSFISYVEQFLSKNLYNNVPELSSIHTMKGGEADKVIIYDYPRFPYKFRNQSMDEEQQEENLQYVALTRAKKELYLALIDNPDNPNDVELDINCKGKVDMLLNVKD